MILMGEIIKYIYILLMFMMLGYIFRRVFRWRFWLYIVSVNICKCKSIMALDIEAAWWPLFHRFRFVFMYMACKMSVSMRFVHIMVFLFSFFVFFIFSSFILYTISQKSGKIGNEVSPAPYLIKTQTNEAAQWFSTLIIIIRRNVS